MPTIIVFVLVFGAIVFFHELGHFIVAKVSGVGVYEFALGFGPRLISKQIKGTTYALRLLPLGGFVKLAGMDEAENELDTVEEDDPRSFNNKSLFVRMSTIAAGPVMNFILAFVVLAIYGMTIYLPPTIVYVEEAGTAYQAGVLPGDEIIAINGEPASDDLNEIISLINASGGQELRLTLQREDEIVEVPLVPEGEPGSGIIGIGLNGKPKQSFVVAIGDGLQQTWLFTKELVLGVIGMVRGKVEVDVSGPIGIYKLVGTFAEQGIGSILLLTAVLNVNLGLLNLLPVPVLDGGWIVLFLIEAIRGKPIKEEHRSVAQLVGLALLVSLMVFATWSDISKLL